MYVYLVVCFWLCVCVVVHWVRVVCVFLVVCLCGCELGQSCVCCRSSEVDQRLVWRGGVWRLRLLCLCVCSRSADKDDELVDTQPLVSWCVFVRVCVGVMHCCDCSLTAAGVSGL